MANLSAKLEADFSEFDRAVVTSLQKLDQFEAKAARTGAGLTTMATTPQSGLGALQKQLEMVDKSLALAGVNVSRHIAALKEMQTAANQGASALGKLGTGLLVEQAFEKGWDFGRWIAGWTGVDEAISKATASLMGWGDVAAETAAATQDEIDRVRELTGKTMTLAEARAYMTKKKKEDNEEAKKAAEFAKEEAESIARINAVYVNYQKTLDGIAGTTVEAAKAMLEQGAAARDVGNYLGLAADQMNVIEIAMKKEHEALEKTKKLKEDLAGVEQIRIGLAYQQLEAVGKQSSEIEDLKRLTAQYDALKTKLKELGEQAYKGVEAINQTRNLGPAQRDIAAEAAGTRDEEIDAINKLAAAGMDMVKVWGYTQKAWQDFDARLGNILPGREAGIMPLSAAVPPKVEVNVSGVFDPRSIAELATALDQFWMQRAARQWPGH